MTVQCEHLGTKTGELIPAKTGTGRYFVYECQHPAHAKTTLLDCLACEHSTLASGCAACLKPETTIATVKQLLAGKPSAWTQGWQDWLNVVQAFKELFHEASAEARKVPAPKWTAERGIVICGGGKFFTSLYVTCRVIRHVGCQLPIQVWHLDGERDAQMTAMTDKIGGIEWVDAQAAWRDRPEMRLRPMNGFDHGWMLKPFAAAFSPFAEVISLDADCYPARDPELLLESSEFETFGAIFWPDHEPLKAEQWKRFATWPKNMSVESGQFLVDKRQHWPALWLTCWLAAHHDYVWDSGHIYGDKDTFSFAWRKLGHDMCQPTKKPEWHGVAYIHKDFEGRTAFVHRCMDKFRVADERYATAQISTENVHVKELPHENFCHQVLQECKAI